MCHLNIKSIQNKFEELPSLIKKSRTQLMIVSKSKIDSSILTVNLPFLVTSFTGMIGRKEEEGF